jgi:hypothetical protein
MLVYRFSLEAFWHLRHGGWVGGVADGTGRSCASAAADWPIGVVLADPAAVVARGARLRLHQNIPSGRFIAGDVRFFTVIQCLARPGRYGWPLLRYNAFKAHQAGMPE